MPVGYHGSSGCHVFHKVGGDIGSGEGGGIVMQKVLVVHAVHEGCGTGRCSKASHEVRPGSDCKGPALRPFCRQPTDSTERMHTTGNKSHTQCPQFT